METAERSSHSIRPSRKLLTWVFAAVCVVLLGVCGFLYMKYQEVLHTPNAVDTLVSQLNKTIQLPKESPTLLTISDKSKLTNSTLASEVQNGDQLLVYDVAKKIVVYRPSLKKVTSILSIKSSPAVTDKATRP